MDILYCLQCGDVLSSPMAKCRECGHDNSKEQTTPTNMSRKPIFADLLHDMKHHAKHFGGISLSDQSCRHFLSILQSCRPEENPDRRDSTVGRGKIWVWPYSVRVLRALRAWLNLDENEKQYIVAASKKGIFWSGDDMRVFREMVKLREANPGKSPEDFAKDGARQLAQTIRDKQGIASEGKPNEERKPRAGKDQRIVEVVKRPNPGASKVMYPEIFVAVLECGHEVNFGLSEEVAKSRKYFHCKECE